MQKNRVLLNLLLLMLITIHFHGLGGRLVNTWYYEQFVQSVDFFDMAMRPNPVCISSLSLTILMYHPSHRKTSSIHFSYYDSNSFFTHTLILLLDNPISW